MTKPRIIKELQNDTDFVIQVYSCENNRYKVAVWDTVYGTTKIDSTHTDKEAAIEAAIKLNNQYLFE